MRVRKRKVKYPPEFCYGCGCELEKEEYIVDFGAGEYEFCRMCLQKMCNKINRALENNNDKRGD